MTEPKRRPPAPPRSVYVQCGDCDGRGFVWRWLVFIGEVAVKCARCHGRGERTERVAP